MDKGRRRRRFRATAWPPAAQGLYDPANEHDACGLGFIAHIKGRKSHAIITQGLQILENLTHRGATGADPLQGDGAGILIQLPDAFLRRACGKLGITLPALGQYGVGMVFLPRSRRRAWRASRRSSARSPREGQVLLGWRDVPTDNAGLSERTKEVEPVIRQVFVARGVARHGPGRARAQALRDPQARGPRDPGAARCGTARSSTCRRSRRARSSTRACCSRTRSASTTSTSHDETMVSALAMVHQRFSTNTFPTWDLAHPFRFICHNGEINTLRGNFNWIRAREGAIASTVLGDDLTKLWPLIYDGQSDSASFDNALELLVMGGYPLAHAMMLMIPEAWAGNPLMDEDRRAFYEYHAALMEPWDGPAAMAFTDGRQIGATLDRNGLRPARYIVTDDDFIVMASEVGVLDIPERKIVKKWRLQPGKMLLVDLEQGRIVDDDELKRTLATAKPYREWIDALPRCALEDMPEPAPPRRSEVAAARSPAGVRLHAGRPEDDPRADGAERRGGDRLDGQRRRAAGAVEPAEGLLQLFQAAVRAGDEPADRSDPRGARDVARVVHRAAAEPARGRIRRDAEPPMRLEVAAADPHRRRTWRSSATSSSSPAARSARSSSTSAIRPRGARTAWRPRSRASRAHAEDAIHQGYNILILSDRSVSAELLPIPALLATAAVHEHLVKQGPAHVAPGLVVETGSAREVHHFALLAGYGAEAIHPYLALETLAQLHESIAGDRPEGIGRSASSRRSARACTR